MTRIIEDIESLLDEEDQIAILGLEGTLIEAETNEATDHILERLGVPKRVRRNIYDKARNCNGYVNHGTWEKEAHRAIQEYGDSLNSIEQYVSACQELFAGREPIQGAEEFVSYLKDQGIYTLGLGPSPMLISKPLSEEVGIDGVYRWKDFECSEEGCRIYLDSDLATGRHNLVRMLKDEGKEVMYFGYGKEDGFAVQRADTGLKQRSWLKQGKEAYETAKTAVENNEVMI